jgi:hypothetical protein
MMAAALAALKQSKTSYNTMEKKRDRKPHNETLNKVFVDILNSYTINWNDNTSTTQNPTGKIITYKNK